MATHFILQALQDETRDPNENERERWLSDALLVAVASLLDDDALTMLPIEGALTRQALKLTIES